MKKIISVIVILLLGASIFVFFTKNNSENNIAVNKDIENIKIGYLAIAGALPLFIAQDNGYFADEGLKVELINFKSSNEIAIAASTKQIDLIGIGATNAVIDASVTSKIGFEAFLLNGYTKKKNNEKATDYLLARDGITLDNLKGKKIAFFPGSISKVFANLIFPKYGLELNDIKYIEMAPPNWISALESGAIDAVTAIEPFAQLILNKGSANILIDGYYAEVMEDVPLSAGWFISNHLSSKTEEKIVNAYKKSLNLIKTNRVKALSSFDNNTKISSDIYQTIGLNNWRLINDKGAEESLISFIKLLNDKKAIKESVPENYIWNQK